MGRTKKEEVAEEVAEKLGLEVNESTVEEVVEEVAEKETKLSKMVKEVDLKKLYKFKFNEKAPNQKKDKVVEISGELVKIFLKQGYGVLHK